MSTTRGLDLAKVAGMSDLSLPGQNVHRTRQGSSWLVASPKSSKSIPDVMICESRMGMTVTSLDVSENLKTCLAATVPSVIIVP